jgi:O-succinylbenzoate synthase
MNNEKFFEFIENDSKTVIDKITVIKADTTIRTPLTTKANKIIYYNRPIAFVQVYASEIVGYGECAALELPYYTYEYCDQSIFVLEEFILRELKKNFTNGISLCELHELFSKIQGYNMAKSAVEMALIDLKLKISNLNLQSLLDTSSKIIKFGAVIDGTKPIKELISEVDSLVNKKYSRVKVKINPSIKTEVIKELRNSFNDLEIFVDANETFDSFKEALNYFRELDDLNLRLIEQPFDRDEILKHSRLGGLIASPICLDEPIVSSKIGKNLIELGACDIPCVKTGRMGGIVETLKFHRILEDLGINGYIGGNFASEIGKFVDLLMASLPYFNLTFDFALRDRGLDINLCDEPEVRCIKGQEFGLYLNSDHYGLGKKFDFSALEDRIIHSSTVEFT